MTFIPKMINCLVDEEDEDIYFEENEEHEKLTERLRKTLYFGKLPGTDRPSLPLTEIAVNFFQDAAPRGLGRIDMESAAAVSRHACMSPSGMMTGMLYVERLKHKNPQYLQKISSSDLFLISVLMASKFMYDEGVDDEVLNDEWAASANLELEDLNELERDFLAALDWHLFVKPEEFQAVVASLEQRIALSQGIDRGWFSYTDLLVLLENKKWMQNIKQVINEVSKVIAVCSIAYVLSVATVAASTVLVLHLRTTTPPMKPALPQNHTAFQTPASQLSGPSHSFQPEVPQVKFTHVSTLVEILIRFFGAAYSQLHSQRAQSLINDSKIPGGANFGVWVREQVTGDNTEHGLLKNGNCKCRCQSHKQWKKHYVGRSQGSDCYQSQLIEALPSSPSLLTSSSEMCCCGSLAFLAIPKTDAIFGHTTSTQPVLVFG
ncbi:protein CNPPD1 [Lingula anatina]|uniref:Protein CNPPD1 n=1 Tax=Lingula anatina TaxID=7574 RepID=A0A1S3JH78_LINAN|nr:protein CNPPD1 [Lingula anatina]|eukprot:XP_013409765.1 protein CNPPD1 [Lingula anatina]